VRISSILRQITVLNCILLACILAFASFVLVPIFTIEVRVSSPASAAVPVAENKKEQAAEQVVNPPIQEFAIIAENNLFHPDRIIPVAKKDETIPRPEFVLYGTLIVDNIRIAYLSDRKASRTSPGRGTRQIGLKLGETLSGYTLKEVLSDRATLVRGEDRVELMVISSGNKKERGLASAPGGTAVPPAMTIPGSMAVPPAMTNPGSMAVIPAKPSTRDQQSLPQLQMMPQAPTSTTGQEPSVQIPEPVPGVRTRRPIGRW